MTGRSAGGWEGLGIFFLGKGFILILRSSIIVSPFSSPTSAGSFAMATSSSCFSRGKYSGSNLHWKMVKGTMTTVDRILTK
jgi:hypothetical protein